jgi:metal-sulfur cluster biosynthetic enzyme
MSVPPTAVDPQVVEVLRDVYDPCCADRGISVVDMGLLHTAHVHDGAARVELVLTSGWCPFATRVLSEVKQAVETVPGVETAEVELVWDETWSPDRLSDRARSKLRFLPDPTTVADPAAFAADRWPGLDPGGSDDR